ncbi:MAG: ribosome small subunit-dependent GTPase A [Ruminococcaceae bacterium]|nr:ribosome small subunit-dependent GTPase A [Oscillospiraceae bacterium]
MIRGIIVKGIGGFYYVKSSDDIYTCKAKGAFRKNNILPYVGDYVNIRIVSHEKKEGFIEEICPRKNFLIRPPVANVDRMIIISAVADPGPDTVFIDKMLAICEYNNIEPVLCFNKIDLSHDASVIDEYECIGYKVIRTSVIQGIGLEAIKSLLSDGITAVSGFSGVGKSSLLSYAVEKKLETGVVSDKLARGKHTTRHVELFEVTKGRFFADTPGFSGLDIDIIRKEELAGCFVDFAAYTSDCRFKDCSHTSEIGCAVINAVKDGKIAASRHENYKELYDKLKLINDWERKK